VNKANTELLQWYARERKKVQYFIILLMEFNGGTLTGSTRIFATEVRNIRFGLSTDGMNPFGETCSSHSTCLVTLCIYNLPSWLCMKRKFIMMPLLISGPVQVGNDIDVYLQPLIDDSLCCGKRGRQNMG
jgi:hypothetical protein